MQVSKWGNSLAVRIPAAVVDALDLREGDHIDLVVDDSRTFAVRKRADADQRMAQLRAFRGRLPADFVFRRDEANERG